jgi:hypothetical protein
MCPRILIYSLVIAFNLLISLSHFERFFFSKKDISKSDFGLFLKFGQYLL